MRRYGVARYLTDEQRQRAAQATYELVDVDNYCERGDCWDKGAFVPAARHAVTVPRYGMPDRVIYQCPLMVALDERYSLDPWEFEARVAKSADGSNAGALQAAQRYMHAVDSGVIRPEDVPASLGVEP